MILRIATLLAALLLLVTAIPAAEAVLPTNEVNDVLWCVDTTSRTVQDAVHAYAAWLAATYDANYRAIKCKLHQRPPIVIDGNELLTNYGLANGIVGGSGSWNDPYIIENWEIPGSDTLTVYPAGSDPVTTPKIQEYSIAFRAGITIKNTDKAFVIRKVYVHGFDCSSCVGIKLENAPWVRIEDSAVINNRVSIDIGGSWSGFPRVERNHITASELPMRVFTGSPYIRHNVFDSHTAQYDLWLENTDWNAPLEVRENEFLGARVGIGFRAVAWAWIYNNHICTPQQFDIQVSHHLAFGGNGCW